MAGRVKFDCPNGTRADGYLSSGPKACAGVVVLQEWWGLNEQICAVADRCAAEGYAALVPDLYDGRVTDDADEANHMMSGLDWVGAVDVEVAGALHYLKAAVPRVAVMGFCMGGALSIIAGVKLATCDAVVCYYGIPPDNQADPGTIRVPLLGHFAKRDTWYPPAAVDALEASLEKSGVRHEIHSYDADHAFFNEAGTAYDAVAADLAWGRTRDFLRTHL